MKKTLLVLSAILALSMAFVGCKKSTGGDESDKSEPPAKPEALILNCKDYNNYAEFTIPEGTDLSGYNEVHATWKWESSEGIQAAIQLMYKTGEKDEKGNDVYKQASPSTNLPKGDYADSKSSCLKGSNYDDWSTGKAVSTPCFDKTNCAQFYIQNSSYQACAGTIYVKKVWLTGPGKADLVVFEF